MDKLVSVIMPCFNSENTISKSIEGILYQTYTNFELIIIDDCSVDNSVQIINEYIKNDKRIRLYSTDSNSGRPCIPRNMGIDNAIGNYIAFCDSDDIWLPFKLEEQLSFFDNSTAIVYSHYEKIDLLYNRNNRIVKAPSYASYKTLLNGNYIGNLTGIYDVSKVGKVPQKNIAHEDYVMWLEILRKGFIGKNTGTVTALYREGKGSFSSSKLKAISWQWNIYRNVLHLNLFKSIYHFILYSFKALIKYLK